MRAGWDRLRTTWTTWDRWNARWTSSTQCWRTRLSLSSPTCVLPSPAIPTTSNSAPQLHQLTPPVLTCLLTSSLPPASPPSHHTPLTIRTSASSLLHLLLARHSASYPSLKPRITKTLLRGLGGENRGLGGRWGAARGLAGIVRGEGGNMAVREWVGGGLKSLGEMMEREAEGEDGERDMVVGEVLVRLFFPGSVARRVLIWTSQRVLRASLLPVEAEGEELSGPPEMEELHMRYGPLFGSAISASWAEGGKEIYDAVPGAVAEGRAGENAMQE